MKKNGPKPIILFLLAIVALFLGSMFYRFVENWSWLDSLYFSVITLTTVGYGDLAPITTLGKTFTIFYVFIGIGIIFAAIHSIALKGLEKAVKRKTIINKDQEKQKELK